MSENKFSLQPVARDNNSFFTLTNYIGNDNFAFNNKGIALITDFSTFSSNVRKSIDKFKNHFKNITIYDAGTVEGLETRVIVDLIQYLNSKGIIPFIIGIDIEILGKVASLLNKNLYQISNKITNIANESRFVNNNFIAFQRHLCELDDIYEIEENYHNALSLGKMRTYPYLAEPIIRDCNLLHFNLNAMRSSECRDIDGTLPTGLNAEEICQLLKYAGTANNLKAIIVKPYDTGLSSDAAELIAEALWYFAEGMNLQHTHDHPAINQDYSQFIITNPESSNDFLFVKNNLTHRWWVEKSTDETPQYLACSYEEYECCVNNAEPTDRIEKFLNY